MVRPRPLQVPEVPAHDVLFPVAARLEPGRRAGRDGVLLVVINLVLAGLGRAPQVVERDARVRTRGVGALEEPLQRLAPMVRARERRRRRRRRARGLALRDDVPALLRELLLQEVELGAEAFARVGHSSDAARWRSVGAPAAPNPGCPGGSAAAARARGQPRRNAAGAFCVF